MDELSDAEVFGIRPPAAPVELSDADVFRTAASPVTPAAPAPTPTLQTKPQELSDADVFGTTADTSTPPPQISSPGLLDYGREFVTSAAEGAKNLAASSLKGAAASSSNRPTFPEGENPLELAMKGDPRYADQYSTGVPTGPPKPVTEDPVYQAGAAIEDFGKSVLGPGPGFQGQSWTRDIGGGVGSVAGGVIAGMLSPAAAGLMFVTGGQGEAADRAIKAGATPEQIQRAAHFGTIAGATDVVDALLPALGSSGKAMGFIAKVGSRAIKGALAEGGQEGLQQFIQNVIAKGIYKPDQDLTEDVTHNAIVGAIVGGGVSAVAGQDHAPVVKPTPAEVAAAGADLTGGAVPPAPTVPPPPGTSPVEQLIERAETSIGTNPVFYSAVKKVVETKGPESASASQWLATLNNAPGIKQDEIDNIGLNNFLANHEGPVSKSDLLTFIEDHQVRVQEVIKDADLVKNLTPHEVLTLPSGELGAISQRNQDVAPQYGEYITPGPRGAYRELLLTLPNEAPPRPQGFDSTEAAQFYNTLDGQNYYGSHWNEANVLGHVRFTERIDGSGAPVLYIEEIQSDWHQKGQDIGYKEDNKPLPHIISAEPTSSGPGQFDNSWKLVFSDGTSFNARGVRTQADALTRGAEYIQDRVRVPNAPFKGTSNWSELLLKRMLRYAADNGFSRISWNNGNLAARFAAGGATRPSTVAGLNKFYDQIIPSIARKWAKKLGSTYGETEITTDEFELIPKQAGPGMWGVTSPSDPGVYPLHDYDTSHNETREYYAKSLDEVTSWIAREKIEGKAVARVGYIDLSDRAKSYILQGLPLFTKTTDGNVDVAIDRSIGVVPDLTSGTVDKLRAIVHEFSAKFDIGSKLSLRFTNAPGKANSAGTTAGYARNNGDGTYNIVMHLSFFRTVSDLYVSLMHELGHVIVWNNFNKLPAAHQIEIRAEFDRYRESIKGAKTLEEVLNKRDNAVLVQTGWRGDNSKQYLLRMPPEARRYWMNFDEWFAEQVARWATSNEHALTVAEKGFKGIAKRLLSFFKAATERLGLNFRAGPAMDKWLTSFIETSTPGVGAEILAKADERTKDDNQKELDKVDPGIPAQPAQPEGLGPRAGIEGAFPKQPTPPPILEAAAHADRMNRFYKYMAGLDQLVDANPRFVPLLRYAERVREMHLEEAKIHDAALRVSKAWRKLGAQGENLTALLDEISRMVYRTDDEVKRGVARHPTPAEFAALVAKHKVSAEALKVFTNIRQMFDGFLTLVQQNANVEAARLITNPVALAARLDQIRAMITNLRSRPYFPFMRFGRHFVLVKNAAGDTVHFETFERRGFVSAEARQKSKAAQLERLKEPGEVITTGLLPESVDPLIGMPPLLLQAMRERLELTPQQLDALQQLQFEISPALSFKHRFQHKNYVPGYSMDFKRSFARYFFHGARFYSRTKYAWALRDDIKAAQAVGGNTAGHIADYMRDNLKNTVLDAKGDFGVFKAGIFLWAMGYVPAAAAQNLTQTPMITFPFLAAKFGDARATAAIVKAMSDLSTYYKKGKIDTLSEFEYKALGYGIKTGRISETQAPELAGMSQGANLMDGMGGNKLQRGWQVFMEKAAWMFEMAEQFNRRVAYRAALSLAQKNPNAKIVQEAVVKYADEYKQLLGEYTEAQAKAIVTANHTVDQTQYVYARYARPRFMRGRLSGTLFVFKKYMQSTLFMLGHNKSDVLPRYLIVAMALGGLGGVPGYDDLKGILQALGHWLFGKNFNLDLQIREYVLNMTNGKIPPDMILHGLARRGMGIPALLDMMGSFATGRPGRGFDPALAGQNVPFPVVDRSRALSMGNILPVDLGKLFGPAKDANAVIGDQTQKASGAVFSVGFNIYKAITDNHMEVTDPKRWERAVPRGLGSASRAFRAYYEGRERSRGTPDAASTVVNFDTRDTEQMMEIIAMGLGYQPLRLQAKWDSILATAEVTKYYDMQRSALLEQMHEAISGKNKEEIDSVRNSIIKFNSGLPDFAKGKALSGDTIRRSMEARERSKAARESGTPLQRTNVGISREINRLVPEATVDVRRQRN